MPETVSAAGNDQIVRPLAQLRWGLPSAVLLLMALMLKIMVWPSFQTNRVLRELKLIQLQLARSNRQLDAADKPE